MKVVLTEGMPIKGKDYDAGDIAIVKREVGERLIEDGVANRIIEEPENRMTPVRYSGHKKIFQGSNGKNYVQQGKDYVEIEE